MLHKQSIIEIERQETIITTQANKQKIELEADANAYKIEKIANAQKNSIELIGSSLKSEEGNKVAKIFYNGTTW